MQYAEPEAMDTIPMIVWSSVQLNKDGVPNVDRNDYKAVERQYQEANGREEASINAWISSLNSSGGGSMPKMDHIRQLLNQQITVLSNQKKKLDDESNSLSSLEAGLTSLAISRLNMVRGIQFPENRHEQAALLADSRVWKIYI